MKPLNFTQLHLAMTPRPYPEEASGCGDALGNIFNSLPNGLKVRFEAGSADG